MMHDKQLLLQKYLKRQCSPEELRRLLAYLKEDTEADYQEVMDEIWEELESYPSLAPSTSEAMYEGISARLSSNPAPSATSKGRLILLPNYWRDVSKAAAVFAGILICSWLLYLFFLKADQVVYSTDYGETATIELPDHSVLTLNGNSKVSYQKHWEDKNVREVSLEGEAYFSVEHTADHQKFIVHTSNLEIEVLGTEFNVNHRRGNTKVTLNSGKIKLNSKEDTEQVKDVIMHPGEQAELNRDYRFDLKVVDTKLYTSWKDHELNFDHTSIREVATMIEETYGLQVVLQGDSIQHLELSGTLPANDVEIFMGMLEEIFELYVIRNDHQVIISKK